METEHLEQAFRVMGARLKVGKQRRFRRWRAQPRRFELDVSHDRKGEFFEIRLAPDVDPDAVVLNTQPKDRHLLLMVKGAGDEENADGAKDIQKFLCGHDERSWFVAAVPEKSGASTVRDAMEALKPSGVRASQYRHYVKTKNRNKRKNRGFVRQGEWFFVPRPDVQIDDDVVLENEPLIRGGGKPHIAQHLFRHGGTLVYTCTRFPDGLTEGQYEALIHDRPEMAKLPWQVRSRNPRAFVKGKVRHPDHKTIELKSWHEVLVNTESESAAMRNVAFLD